MIKKITLTIIATAFAATVLAAPAEARVNQRQAAQHHRIAQGVKSGELTRHEATQLRQQQRHIAAYEARSRADGRGYTARERARTEAMQDRASRNIQRQKTDAQRRQSR
jgi:Ni/Co efflux regulator RcnB